VKTLLWKLAYARQMMRRANTTFSFAWQSAGSWVDGYGIEDFTGADACDEELSYWDNDE
jgi:hypothetical protein